MKYCAPYKSSVILLRKQAYAFLLCLAISLLCINPVTFAHKVEGPAPTNNSTNPYDPEPGAPPFDETSVFVNVQRIGGTEMPAVIKGRTIYLPMTNVFDFLKIKAEAAPNFDSVFGYFIDPEAKFCIDNIKYQIRYKGQVFQLQPSDLIQTESNLYLRQEYFSQAFGLTCDFDFSNLTVKLSASVELPAVREMQMELMHRNVSRLKGEIKADTNIKRGYPFFNLGAADWSLSATQQPGADADLRAGLSLGGILAGGELNLYLNYSSQTPFNERQQFYQWRFADNSHKAIRQVTLGRILAQSVATVYNPVDGVQISNTPTTYRKSAGSYRLSRTTQPGWTVELYVNNVLVDFVKADASGFFSFDVPLVYGNSVIKLRYYGLYGEVRTSEENITIPFNFLPKHEFEYNVSAGIVEDTLRSRYGRATMNYGLSRFITMGAGVEYLSSISSGPSMPFVNASARITSNIMVSADYTHGVRGRGMLSYRLPFNSQLELNYTRYAKEQKAIMYSYLEDRKISFSIPIQCKTFSLATRLMLNQLIITENTSYNTAEWLVSGSVRNMSVNVNTVMNSTGQKDPPRFDPNVYTSASLAYRFRSGYAITTQAQYSYKQNAFISSKCELEKNLFNKGYLNVAYEHNFSTNSYGISTGLRFDLSFARIGVASRYSPNGTTFTESGSGSLLFDGRTGYIGTSSRTSVGRAGITILPYLDINGNGQRDKGEPRVDGLKAGISSGRVQYNSRDTVIRMYDMEPYANYFIDVSQNSFENIGWQIKNKTMNVTVDPNRMKLIKVPVTVMSEASGTVFIKDSMGTRPQGRINVCFYRADGSRVGSVLTDQDGYYSYMGLIPGIYTVRIDEAQMKNLHLKASQEKAITVTPLRDGSFIDGLDFSMEADR